MIDMNILGGLVGGRQFAEVGWSNGEECYGDGFALVATLQSPARGTRGSSIATRSTYRGSRRRDMGGRGRLQCPGGVQGLRPVGRLTVVQTPGSDDDEGVTLIILDWCDVALTPAQQWGA